MELLKVSLDVFDETKCNETFEAEIRTTSQLRRGIDSTMMCAGILEGGRDTCQVNLMQRILINHVFPHFSDYRIYFCKIIFINIVADLSKGRNWNEFWSSR